jgi:hypothetical protein
LLIQKSWRAFEKVVAGKKSPQALGWPPQVLIFKSSFFSFKIDQKGLFSDQNVKALFALI